MATQHRPEVEGRVFQRGLRGFTIGILTSVGVVAFESLGVATILPTVARELGGLGGFGWGLSALMLANIVGTVVAGASIDRRGPARTVTVGALTFAAGCLLAGLAPTWTVFVAARAVQGFGVGAIMAYAYSLVGLAYPARLQPVMFAFLSSSWTIPSLVGPVFAGLVTESSGWRVVFWAIAPITVLLVPLIVPSARKVRPAITPARRFVWSGAFPMSLLLAVGTGVFLHGLETGPVALAIVLAGTGAAAGVVALVKLTPAGTLRAARGAPAGIVIRFLLCAVYFGSEAFLPLGLSSIHATSAVLAGLGLAAGALAWTGGSFLQARLDARNPGKRARSTTLGFGILLVGEVLMGLMVALPGPGFGWAIAGWTVAGLGMGIAFNAATSATMVATAAGQEGSISANLQLAQTLATAVAAGAGGAIVAGVGTTTTGFLAIFAVPAALGVIGTSLARRVTISGPR
jgi:MFS family permease